MSVSAGQGAGARLTERAGLWLGLAAVLAVLVMGFLLDPAGLRRAWMTALLVLAAPALGGLGLLLLGHLAGGAWFQHARRHLAALASTIPLLALLALPLLGGHDDLYPTTTMEAGSAAGYRAPAALVLRLALFALLWSGLTWLAARARHRHPALAVAGLMLYLPTVSLAAVDWVMAPAPGWSSSVGGLLFAGAGVLAAAAALPWLAGTEDETPPREAVRQQGALLLAALLAMVYLAYIQFLVVWSADLPAEAVWYLRRAPLVGPGALILGAVMLAATAFAVLMRPSWRRDPLALRVAAGLVLAAGLLHRVWEVAPAFAAPPPLALVLLALAAIAGLWAAQLAFALRRLGARSEPAGM